jgi:hypothetical protein
MFTAHSNVASSSTTQKSMSAALSRLHTGTVRTHSGRCSGQPFCQNRGPSTPSG